MKKRNEFEKIAVKHIHCDICGRIMRPKYGCGVVKDRIVCANHDCEAEITFPTSTEIKKE